MKMTGVLFCAGLLFSSALLAQDHRHPQQGGGNTDVVVDLPDQVWTQGQNTQNNACVRCCVYENRSYSEGAVIKTSEVLLQCVRDKQSLGTNNLIWQSVKP